MLSSPLRVDNRRCPLVAQWAAGLLVFSLGLFPGVAGSAPASTEVVPDLGMKLVWIEPGNSAGLLLRK